jgi:hypothetical protein
MVTNFDKGLENTAQKLLTLYFFANEFSTRTLMLETLQE